jgi:heme a synthase
MDGDVGVDEDDDVVPRLDGPEVARVRGGAVGRLADDEQLVVRAHGGPQRRDHPVEHRRRTRGRHDDRQLRARHRAILSGSAPTLPAVRRLPTVSARQYERFVLVALVLLIAIVLSGAAVRLTGSGLGCENWPRCGDQVYAPLEFHALVEFGNRVVTGIVGIPSVLCFVLAFRRRPRRRDLIWLSALLPLGVLAQAILGGLTVIYELKPGFVMGHFGLSMLILAAAVALYWRAKHEPDERPVHDRRIVLATRALLAWGAVVLFAGTVATAAGPHPGSAGTGEVVPRIDWLGVDALIKWHGRTGTVLGLLALGCWWLARRHGGTRALLRSLTVVCLLVASQGVVGLVQYELELPAGLVWIHVVLATFTWLAILFSVAAAGRAVRHPSGEPVAIPRSGEVPTRTLAETR